MRHTYCHLLQSGEHLHCECMHERIYNSSAELILECINCKLIKHRVHVVVLTCLLACPAYKIKEITFCMRLILADLCLHKIELQIPIMVFWLNERCLVDLVATRRISRSTGASLCSSSIKLFHVKLSKTPADKTDGTALIHRAESSLRIIWPIPFTTVFLITGSLRVCFATLR